MPFIQQQQKTCATQYCRFPCDIPGELAVGNSFYPQSRHIPRCHLCCISLFFQHILHFPHSPFEMMIFVHWISMHSPNVYRSTEDSREIWDKKVPMERSRLLSAVCKANFRQRMESAGSKEKVQRNRRNQEEKNAPRQAKISRIKSVSIAVCSRSYHFTLSCSRSLSHSFSRSRSDGNGKTCRI